MRGKMRGRARSVGVSVTEQKRQELEQPGNQGAKSSGKGGLCAFFERFFVKIRNRYLWEDKDHFHNCLCHESDRCVHVLLIRFAGL